MSLRKNLHLLASLYYRLTDLNLCPSLWLENRCAHVACSHRIWVRNFITIWSRLLVQLQQTLIYSVCPFTWTTNVLDQVPLAKQYLHWIYWKTTLKYFWWGLCPIHSTAILHTNVSYLYTSSQGKSHTCVTSYFTYKYLKHNYTTLNLLHSSQVYLWFLPRAGTRQLEWEEMLNSTAVNNLGPVV